MAVEVAVQYAASRRGVPRAATVSKWVHAALRGRRRSASLTVRFVNAREGRALNQRWRGKSGATNVLSFLGGGTGSAACLGDIVICVPIVESEATAQQKSVRAHYAHMVVHGVLHLLGYDHQQARRAEEMEALETATLRRLGYPDPYRYADTP